MKQHAAAFTLAIVMASAALAAEGKLEGKFERNLEPLLGEPTIDIQQAFKDQRLPNVVVATDGAVLAAWGWGQVRVRRSEDGGTTWGPEIAVGKGLLSGGVTLDEKTGDILLFTEAKHPPAPLTMYRSQDHGKSWKEEAVVIHPDGNGNVPSMCMAEHGITLRHGEHVGRLLRPARVYEGKRGYNSAVYSDDGGKHWRSSGPFPIVGTGEGAVAELSNGHVYYSSRNHWFEKEENFRYQRPFAWSYDGGATWRDAGYHKELPDGPRYRGSRRGSNYNGHFGMMCGLARLPVENRDILVYSNADTPEHHRVRMTVWASFDGGKSWPVKRLVFAGPSAYSSLDAGRPGTPAEGWIYLLFESGGAKMARFNLSWLLEGEKTGDGDVPEWVTIASNSASATEARKRDDGVWRPLPTSLEDGLLTQRVACWERNRLWHMVDGEGGYMLSGFQSRPGQHPWQGEHVGKWLHAATLAHERTGNEQLGKTLRETVERLLDAQEPNGYLGTYAQKSRFYSIPAANHWDVWTHRYNLYGLLTHERFHPDDRVVKACERIADLLIGTFGEGKADITRNGTRRGISSTTVLESIMMLYERTREERLLKFAEHIVKCSENAPGLRLMGAMLKKEDVSGPGEGKAYQLMANLLGYAILYKHTGDHRYLETAQNGWENIKAHHIYITGGPWSRHTDYNGNKECFALPRDFAPAEAVVETCSTTTWIQLNLHLLELTGLARYAAEAERAVFNALMAAQHRDGIDWCYFTRANEAYRGYSPKITCCASSGPRALEMFSRYLIGEVDGGIALASLVPCSAVLPEAFGKAKIKVTGSYPCSPRVGIRFEEAGGKEFAIEFRDPADARLTSVRINGDDIALSKNDRGFYRIRRAWKSGDGIDIDFEYLLKSHIEAPKDGPRWVAFTYGPWALAQTTEKGAAVAEPFVGKDFRPEAASEWMEASSPEKAGEVRFRIKNTQMLLTPYCHAGGRNSGPRTYFQF